MENAFIGQLILFPVMNFMLVLTLLRCLSKAGLEKKIQVITVDNASVNKVIIEKVEKILNEKNIEFQAELQHFWCLSHILNVAAQNVFAELHVDVGSDKDFYDLHENNRR